MILSSRSSKYWLLNIWTLRIHLTVKFYWKRKSSDYTLRLQIQIQIQIQIFLFPIKEPFRAEQLTKNLIQWLWIDYIGLQATIHYISDCQQAPIHCNSCITIFDPIFLVIDTTYKKNLSLHVKSIYERLLKNVYFNIITFSNIL
jgi:hypothetical protein